jgi:hypothetical protein
MERFFGHFGLFVSPSIILMVSLFKSIGWYWTIVLIIFALVIIGIIIMAFINWIRESIKKWLKK